MSFCRSAASAMSDLSAKYFPTRSTKGTSHWSSLTSKSCTPSVPLDSTTDDTTVPASETSSSSSSFSVFSVLIELVDLEPSDFSDIATLSLFSGTIGDYCLLASSDVDGFSSSVLLLRSKPSPLRSDSLYALLLRKGKGPSFSS